MTMSLRSFNGWEQVSWCELICQMEWTVMCLEDFRLEGIEITTFLSAGDSEGDVIGRLVACRVWFYIVV